MIRLLLYILIIASTPKDNLRESDILKYVLVAGFSEDIAETMVCIARYESAFNPKAINVNPDGNRDIGLFQINEKWWKDKCDIEELFDPLYNTVCAKVIYDTQGLSAWVAYTKNKDVCDNYKIGRK